MPLYPHLSQPGERLCNNPDGSVCPTYPCIHVACHDPDWLEDLEELAADQESNKMAWDLYKSMYGKFRSTGPKDKLSAEKWDFFRPKVERCRRIRDKWDQINQDFVAHAEYTRAQYMEEQEKRLRRKIPSLL
jgi:hypothetical protein